MSIKSMPKSPCNEHAARELIENGAIHHKTDDEDRSQNYGYRGRVAERDRNEGDEHDTLALAVQAESNGEQPAHRGIDAVIESERDQRHPGPQLGSHGVNIPVCPGRSAA